MSLPPNWATLVQPPPRNHGTPAIDALRPGQPLRELVGDMLADAAIVRALLIGLPTYKSYLTPNNGQDNIVGGLQEDADGAAYHTAAYYEAPEGSRERYLLGRSLQLRGESAGYAELAAVERAKRLAKAKGEGK